MEKTEMMQRLKERMREVPPLPDEEEFTTSDETIGRYLKAFEWKYADAESGLLQTVEYRREYQPLRKDCNWCHKQAGFHSMRQVGHDESGRPVVYANFAQATAKKNTFEDVVAHMTYLIENAKATMGTGVSNWVFIIDCTGMSVSVCRPKVGLRAASVLSSHYPERLGMVICVNHNPIFHAFWKAIKTFLAPGTVAKMRLLRSESKIKQTFATFFSDELSNWLWQEITLNKSKPLSQPQRNFWAAPANPEDHDPRGCASYIEEYITRFVPSVAQFVQGQKKVHWPHPNVVWLPESEGEVVTSNGDASSGGSQMDEEGAPKGSLSDDELEGEFGYHLQEGMNGSDLEDGSGSEESAPSSTKAVKEVGNADNSQGEQTENGAMVNGKVQ